jgi:hypothetical protein
MRLITEKGNAITEKGNSICKVYEFNKDIDKWKPLPKKETALPKKVKVITEKGNASLPKKGTTKETTTKETTKDIFVLPEWIPQELWTAYLEVRKKKRAPSTPSALNLCIKSINKLHVKGNDRLAVIEQSVERGYTGFFELSGGNNGQHQGYIGGKYGRQPAGIQEDLAESKRELRRKLDAIDSHKSDPA